MENRLFFLDKGVRGYDPYKKSLRVSNICDTVTYVKVHNKVDPTNTNHEATMKKRVENIEIMWQHKL